MMRKITTLMFAMLLISLTTFAQLPPNSIAPNFTATDINGVEHTLYDYLDEGKVVILDMYATWCGPCLTYHESGVLETLYEEHGPDGDNTLMVIMIEADQSTDTGCIYGPADCRAYNNQTGTWGDEPGATIADWTEGTPYPIIDDGGEGFLTGIASAFAINYFPTLYTVYPNRLITESGQLSLGAYQDIIDPDNFVSAVGLDSDVSVLAASYGPQYCAIQGPVPTFRVQSLGSETLTSFDATLIMDGEPIEEMTWEGEAELYDLIDIAFSPVADVTGSASFSIEVSNPNGEEDTNTSNDQQTATGPTTSPSDDFYIGETIEISVYTDQWPTEHYWALYGPDGNIIGESPVYTEAYVTFEETFNVGLGCYRLVVTDSYGDGFDGIASGAPENGSLSITTENGVIYEGFDFGAGFDITFALAEAVELEASVESDLSDEGVLTLTTVSNDPTSTTEWEINGETFDGNELEYAFTQNGTYDVVATITNPSGEVVVEETITVEVAPQPNFTASQGDESTAVVTVEDASTFNEDGTYSWDFGDGSDAVEGVDPGEYSYTTNGEHTITLTITNDFGTTTYTQLVTVAELPVADFMVEQDSGNDGIVNFTNMSLFDEAWSWNFGDDSSSSEENPGEHVYEFNGTYTVVLQVFNAVEGGLDTKTATIEVTKANNVGVTALESVNSLEVFPIPTTNELNVAFDVTTTQDLRVEITNMVGQTVAVVNEGQMQQGQYNLSVNTTDYASGIYFVNITDGKNTTATRFVVSK